MPEERKKYSKKQEKYQATLVEQKRNYQKHLRSLQRKSRTEAAKKTKDDLESYRLMRREKCFGIPSSAEAINTGCEGRYCSWQPWTSAPASARPDSWSSGRFFVAAVPVTPVNLAEFFIQTQIPRAKKVRTCILQREASGEEQKDVRKSSFCMESLLRAE